MENPWKIVPYMDYIHGFHGKFYGKSMENQIKKYNTQMKSDFDLTYSLINENHACIFM
jgi:hypothetical protein